MKKIILLLSFVLSVSFVTNAAAQYGQDQGNPGSTISQLFVTQNNYINVVWGNYNPDSHSYDMLMTKSDNVGNSFEKIINFTDFANSNSNNFGGIQYFSRTTLADDGYIYFVWSDYPNANDESKVYFRRSIDNGNTFEDTIILKSTPGRASIHQLVADKNNVYILINNLRDNKITDLLFYSSDDYGKTFGNGVNLSVDPDTILDLSSIATSNNNVYVVSQGDYWGKSAGDIFFTKSLDYGKTFENIVNLSGDDASQVFNPRLVAHGENIYIVWAEHKYSKDYEIFFVKSNDNGNTFSEKMAINENIEGSNYKTYYGRSQPEISIGDKDTIYVKWYDEGRIFFRKSIDSGNHFDEIINLTGNTRDQLSSSSLASYGNNVYITWNTSAKYPFYHNAFFIAISVDGGNTFDHIANLSVDDGRLIGIANILMTVNNYGVYIVGDPGTSGDNSIIFRAEKHGSLFLEDVKDLSEGLNIAIQNTPSYPTLMISPHFQYKNGASVNSVECIKSLELIIKSNSYPACVKPETKQKLIERGWARQTEFSINNKD